MRGVILAGGLGTRLNPFTKYNNKHLAPIYTEEGAIPILYYPIKTLVDSGITDILVISSQEHSGKIIEVLGDGDDFGQSHDLVAAFDLHLHLFLDRIGGADGNFNFFGGALADEEIIGALEVLNNGLIEFIACDANGL